jgi:hypothetical protein
MLFFCWHLNVIRSAQAHGTTTDTKRRKENESEIHPKHKTKAKEKHFSAPPPPPLFKELLRKWLDPDEEQEKLGKALAERVYQESTLFAKFSSWKDKVIESIAKDTHTHEHKQIYEHGSTNTKH